MALQKVDREFRLNKLCLIDYKQIENERMLTAFLARLHHNGASSRLARREELKPEQFADELAENPRCNGFAQHRDIVELWIENQLFDVVNRGKPNQTLAAPRPLHGFTYRFRNPKASRDYDSSAQLYELLDHARQGLGQATLEHLRAFFFKGIDPHTEQADASIQVDVETQALLHMLVKVADASDSKRDVQHPVCVGSCDLLADDVQRLLCYQDHIPRTVMVEYLKVLFGFHMGLYLLRMVQIVPTMLRSPQNISHCSVTQCPAEPRKNGDPLQGCPFKLQILADMTGKPDSSAAQMAIKSFQIYQQGIPSFIRASFTFKKLDEFHQNLRKMARPVGTATSLADLLPLLDDAWSQDRDKFFGSRLSNLIERASSEDGEIDPSWKRIQALELGDMETYLELILHERADFHRKYIVQCIDSLLMKNKPGALLAQPKGRNQPRRFVLDSRLLEVLLQIAVLQPTDQGFESMPMRIDQLLIWLKNRYGICIDQLPNMADVGSEERVALRENRRFFVQRLREVGFYRDLSDAHVTQTILPRYEVSTIRPGRNS
jgi:hypothetical protein